MPALRAAAGVGAVAPATGADTAGCTPQPPRIHSPAFTLQRESAATAPALRDTLHQLSHTGSNAEKTSSEAQQLMRTSQPARLRTLEDIQTLTRSSDRLRRNLMGLFGTESDDAPAKPGRPSATIGQ
ncbi:MAG: hypothetical protein RLZZ516_1045 [Cyanobacteriota bacterium]